MADVVVVLSTLPAGFVATELARKLVEQGVAACVNIIPGVTSVYRWKGKIEVESEQQLVIKTTTAQVEKLRAALGPLHPYELPEFIVLPVQERSDEYLDWIKELDA